MAKKKGALTSPFVPAEEQPYKIPENWCWIRLLDSFENRTDSKKKVQSKTYLENGKLAVVDQGQELIGGYTDDENMAYSGKLPVIIFGDHTRCVKYIDFPFVQGADGVKVLLPKPFYDAQAFYFALQSIDIPNMGYRRHYPLFPQFCIPIPPLPEQHRIVARIESLFAKLDEAKEKAQAVVDGFELRRSAILHKAFTGELTERWRKEHGVCRESWSITPLGELTEIQSSKRIYKEEYVKSGIPFFRSSEVVELNDFGYTEPQFFISSSRYEEIKLQYGVPEQGDLLVTSVGTIGKTWIVDSRPFYYKDGNLTQVKQCSAVNMKYLQFYIRSEGFKEQIRNSVAGSAYNALTIVKFKKIEIPVPSREEQSAIVGALDRIVTQERQAKEAAEAVLAQIDTMKKAILARAFRGELGTNDPAEEWAGELVKKAL